jgi:hypothetical protein
VNVMPMPKLPIGKAFMLIEPGPVILVTTNNKGRNTWHMVLDFTPQIALKTGPWNYSYEALTHTRECAGSSHD